MVRMTQSIFATILISLVSAPALGAAESARPPAPTGPAVGTHPLTHPGGQPPQRPEVSPDAANDPPGLLTADRLAPIAELTAQLSSDRTWLDENVLKALNERAVSIDEIFTDAPRFLAVDGTHYRIKLEMVGELWDGFDPARDPFAVFISHEVFDGLGKDRAVAFEEGEWVTFYRNDFERIPALALTLAGTTPIERPDGPEPVHELGASSIPLGEPRPEVAFRPGGVAPEKHPTRIAPKSHCDPDVAPTSCDRSTLVCPSGYTPYFVVQSLRLFDDHEGCCFKGAPEIELFPLRIDSSSGLGGSTDATTDWIFDGRYVTDLEGRSRYLPDVDDDNSAWYDVSGGLAIFPTDTGTEWSSTLVEDDDEKGRLKIDKDKINVTEVLDTGKDIWDDIREMEYFELLKDTVSLIDILGVLSDSDDLYQKSLGVTNGLFCSEALGQSHPQVFTLSSNEWELQGYFACLNADCEDSDGGGGGGGGTCDEGSPCLE